MAGLSTNKLRVRVFLVRLVGRKVSFLLGLLGVEVFWLSITNH